MEVADVEDESELLVEPLLDDVVLLLVLVVPLLVMVVPPLLVMVVPPLVFVVPPLVLVVPPLVLPPITLKIVKIVLLPVIFVKLSFQPTKAYPSCSGTLGSTALPPASTNCSLIT